MAIEKDKEALLIMDVQPGIVERLSNKEDYLAKTQAAIDVAHQAQLPVIFVVVGFRPGLPEVSESNKSFATIKDSGNADRMINPRPTIEPTANDIVVVKRRVSAFTGSDLEVVLRGIACKHLILTGIATSGVVLSTLREAADKDYQLTVLSDLCSDFDEEVHTTLTEKVFPRQANVISSSEWIQHIQEGGVKK